MINIEQVLKDLYDSEIGFHMWFLWDGGWDYAFCNSPYPLSMSIPEAEIQHTWTSDLQKVFQFVIDDALKQFPNSTFAKKYAK
jgi:hypothetical protein